MDRTITAIPTKYKGIQMRSRLEATWAAVFDGLEWKWEYEPPIDFPKLECGRWLPDFEIKCKYNNYECQQHSGILVEVKGVDSFDDMWDNDEIERAIENAISVDRSILLLGPRPTKWTNRHLDFGLIASPCTAGEKVTCNLIFSVECSPDSWDVVGSYNPVTIGPYISGQTIAPFLPDGFGCGDLFDRVWENAKNAVQWRPK